MELSPKEYLLSQLKNGKFSPLRAELASDARLAHLFLVNPDVSHLVVQAVPPEERQKLCASATSLFADTEEFDESLEKFGCIPSFRSSGRPAEENPLLADVYDAQYFAYSNEVCENGNSILMNVLQQGRADIETIDHLVRIGHNVAFVNRDGENALHYCRDPMTAIYLRSLGVEATTDIRGKTPFMNFIQHGDEGLLECLGDFDPFSEDNWGNTIVDYLKKFSPALYTHYGLKIHGVSRKE